MEFEWDEAKRQTNIAKHGIDFRDAKDVFQGKVLPIEGRTVGNEERWLAIGALLGAIVTVVYVERNRSIRIISVRRARDNERRAYREVFGGGVAGDD